MILRVNDGLVSTLSIGGRCGRRWFIFDWYTTGGYFGGNCWLVLSASLLASLSLQQSLVWCTAGRNRAREETYSNQSPWWKWIKSRPYSLWLEYPINNKDWHKNSLPLITIVTTHYWNSYGCAGFWCHLRGACGDHRYGRVGPWMYPPLFKSSVRLHHGVFLNSCHRM